MADSRPSSGQARTVFKLSKRALKDARQHDMDCIKAEAVAAGFEKSGVQGTFDGIEEVNDIALRCGDSRGMLTIRFDDDNGGNWYFKDAVAPPLRIATWTAITPEHVESLELTPSEVYFLEWSRTWEFYIDDFWTGSSPFTHIDGFIDHLKQNHEAVYSTSFTKSAAKRD